MTKKIQNFSFFAPAKKERLPALKKNRQSFIKYSNKYAVSILDIKQYLRFFVS